MTTQRGLRKFRRTMALLVAAALTAVFTLLGTLAFPSIADAAANKVAVCHAQGNGGYHLINVAENALPAHVQHGDASPGAAVPDQPNLNFDDSCTPVDSTAPVVTVADVSAEATSADGAVVSYDANAVDAVDGPIGVVCDLPSGSTFPLGETTVTCEATDNAGNTGTASFTVTVVDSTAPVVTVPADAADISAEATSASGGVVSYDASAVDAVDGPIGVVCDLPSGSTFPLGETTVTCEATDNAGNTGTASFTVTMAVEETTGGASDGDFCTDTICYSYLVIDYFTFGG